MSASSASPADLADAIRWQAVQAGAESPQVRGSDWRQATVATVGTDGTVVTSDGVTARRLESYQGPVIGDRIIISLNSSGNWITAGRLATATDVLGQILFARKTVDTARTSTTTSTDDPHLSVPVSASATYTVDGLIIYNTPQAADFKFQFAVPAGATQLWSPWAISDDSDVNAGGTVGRIRTGTSTGGATQLGVLATVNVTCRPVGLIRTGATAGTVVVQWAQGASSASATTVVTDSWIKLQRVA
ncbi:hypothetical protein [Streptomyces syringium]|uniref:hypothetical protein n=1 Tax=Streptomyces syringium TaxID=76729 RepID=UPI003AADF8D8